MNFCIDYNIINWISKSNNKYWTQLIPVITITAPSPIGCLFSIFIKTWLRDNNTLLTKYHERKQHFAFQFRTPPQTTSTGSDRTSPVFSASLRNDQIAIQQTESISSPQPSVFIIYYFRVVFKYRLPPVSEKGSLIDEPHPFVPKVL
jgi:hypothetical protein